jgi:hypothetical protein
MTSVCWFCGLPLSDTAFCSNCGAMEHDLLKKMNELAFDVVLEKAISEEQLDFMRKLHRGNQLFLFENIRAGFCKNKEMDGKEIETLLFIKEKLQFSDQEIFFSERILPHVYLECVRNRNSLPKIDLESSINFILKKGEIIHFTAPCVLMEMKTVNLGYYGASQGVSFRIMKGVYYRIGSYKGNLLKEDRCVETSRGMLALL